MADLIVGDNGKITVSSKKKKKETDLIVNDKGEITVNKNRSSNIAPIKSNSSKKENNKWYNNFFKGSSAFNNIGSAFDDGYDIGDISKTLYKTGEATVKTAASTVADVGLNVLKAPVGIGEGIGKGIVGGAAQVADWTGNDEYATKLRNRLAGKESLKYDVRISNLLNKGTDAVDKNSVSGDTTDKLTNAISYSATAALTTPIIGSAGSLAMLGTAAGGDTLAESYKEEDVKDWQAWLRAAGSGTITAVTESIFGMFGVGGSALDDALVKVGTRKLESATAKALARTGIKATGEAAEELLDYTANYFLDHGIDMLTKYTKANDVTFGEAWNNDEVLEQMAIAALSTGISSGGKFAIDTNQEANYNIESEKNRLGRNLTSTEIKNIKDKTLSTSLERYNNEGYSNNEQKVIDTLTDEKVSEISKQRSVDKAIETAILEKEKEQGGILSNKEKTALKEQINAKIDSGEITLQNTKLKSKELATIREEIEEQLQKGTLDTDKVDSILGNSITENDGMLARSYIERAKRSKNFNYDTETVKDEKAKSVYESATKYFNDTSRSHEFVDKVAQIAQEKGTSYGFINNEELKSLGHDVEGKQVNGLVRTNQDGTSKILINVDSPKALNTIVGHETTHLLEGTNEYKELQTAIFDYAKQKGDFDRVKTNLGQLYEGIDGANVDNEVTADLVGDYLFTDEKFIQSLSTQKPTVFEKVKSLIDDLVVKFTGTKEEKALREVQKKFKEAYKQNASNMNVEGNKYSVSNIDNKGRTLTKEQQDYFKDSKVRDSKGNLEVMYRGDTGEIINIFDKNKSRKSNLYGTGFYFSDEIMASLYGNTTPYYLNIKNPLYVNENTYNITKEQYKKFIELAKTNEDYSFENYGNISTDELVNKLYDGRSDFKLINDVVATAMGDYRDAFEIFEQANGVKYDGIISNSQTVVFDSNQIKNIDNQNPTTNEDIRYSLSTDNKGNTLSPQMEERMKNSKVRDENGNLKVVYHGTNSDFSVFDYNKIGNNGVQEGIGFYFSDSDKIADMYNKEGKVIQSYIDISKPVSTEEITLTRQQLRDVINDMGEKADDYLWNYGDISEDRNGAINDAIDNLLNYEQSDRDIVSELAYNLDPEDVYKSLKKITGYDGIIVENYNGSGTNTYVVFGQNQIKDITNQNPTDNPDINMSLSNQNEEIAPTGNYNVYGKDIKVEQTLQQQLTEAVNEVKQLREEVNKLVEAPYEPSKVGTTEEQTDLYNQNNFDNLDKQGIAPVIDTTPEYKYQNSNDPIMTDTKNLFKTRDYAEVGNKNVNAYQYEHPEVRPYFQEVASDMLNDLKNSVKGQRMVVGDISQLGEGNFEYTGTTRQTTQDIAELLDGVDGKYKLSYADIEKGLNALIEDHGAENIAAAKRIEFYIDQRLRNGYTDSFGNEIPANQDYIYEIEAAGYENFYNSLPIGEAPAEVASNTEVKENIAPIKQQINEQMIKGNGLKVASDQIAPTKINDSIPNTSRGEQLKIESVNESDAKTAQILDSKPIRNKEQRLKQIATINLVDKGYYISKLARKTNNRQLDALWDNTLLSQAQAQETIGEGRYKFNEATKTYDKVGESIYEIFEGLENADKVKDFNEYMYHRLNIERMLENKPVFGEEVSGLKSQLKVNELEQNNPEFADYAKRVYEYESGENSDLSALVEAGVLSQEQADYYRNKYSNYVPIIRNIDTGFLEGQIFGKKASVKNPIKNAVGGNQDLIPLKDAMAIKTMLVQKSVNMNKLGLELKKTLNSTIETETVTADQVIDAMANGNDLIKVGANGTPTMTVYENGVKTTFEIPMDIYDALKVNNDSFTKLTFKPLNAYSNFKRNVLTQYNPFFMVTNAIKDSQDVLINSQHPAKTYAAFPEAIAQLTNKGYWYREMQSQGLFQDTYYDNIEGFDTKPKGLAKIQEFYPLKKISQINDFIERVPRMAEYIASRKAGATVEVASLDASRVTTNFKAGGDLTKFANRNGATFLNASVQGAAQQIRNVQEAHQQGLKGYVKLATKFAIAAAPSLILNNLVWDDDEDYEELSDYIKDNYYIIGKFGDGQFIRIPKGRMTAVIQKGLQQIDAARTGNDEVDLNNYLDMVINNLAPNNPFENNVLSPFINTKLFNNDDPGKTWYGGDLVPTRLQNKPAAEQYDETTDEFSKWLGKKLNLSPIKINNLIDQNTGVIGDLLLPTMTAEAKTKNSNPIAAAVEDKFTADIVFDNKNSTNFYATKESLNKKTNAYDAKDEDILKNKYMNSKQAEMNDIYKEIRDVQNSNLSKSEKYSKVRDLKKQINDISEEALNNYKNVEVKDTYSKVADKEYYKNNKGEWSAINKDEAATLDSMNMSTDEKNTYFKTRNTISEIRGSDEENTYTKKKEIAGTIKSSGLSDVSKAYLYDKYYASTDKLDVVLKTNIGMDNYLDIEAQEFTADKDSNGKTISGSKKKKIYDYINSTNLEYEQKIILAKLYYSSEKRYNNDIVNYLNNSNISYDDEVKVLETLGMKVDSNGNVRW